MTLLRISIGLLLFSLVTMPSYAASPQPRIVGGVESSQNSWPFMSALMYKSLGISIDNQLYETIFFAQSPAQIFGGELVNCGKAFTACTDALGKVCLIERGETFFSEKVKNCEAGGGIGAIVYNNEMGVFYGSLGRSSSNIPVVSITQASGMTLLNHIGEVMNIAYTSQLSTMSFCGASYIGGRWLVTAAHCVQDVDPSIVFANVGGHDLEVDANNVINISRIIIHENYNPDYLEDDIALVELDREPQGVYPLEIASESLLAAALINGDAAIELGRGQQLAILPGDTPPPVLTPSELFEVDVNLVSNSDCNTSFINYFSDMGENISELVTDKMVCAGTPQGNVGTCFGDSGGPLVLQVGGINYLVGATSWGLGCAVPGVFDVFTRVPFYKTSIEKVVAGETNRLGNAGATGSFSPQLPVSSPPDTASSDTPPEIAFKGSGSDQKFLGSLNSMLFSIFLFLFCFRSVRKVRE